jgi:hypothetical protein
MLPTEVDPRVHRRRVVWTVLGAVPSPLLGSAVMLTLSAVVPGVSAELESWRVAALITAMALLCSSCVALVWALVEALRVNRILGGWPDRGAVRWLWGRDVALHPELRASAVRAAPHAASELGWTVASNALLWPAILLVVSTLIGASSSQLVNAVAIGLAAFTTVTGVVVLAIFAPIGLRRRAAARRRAREPVAAVA